VKLTSLGASHIQTSELKEYANGMGYNLKPKKKS